MSFPYATGKKPESAHGRVHLALPALVDTRAHAHRRTCIIRGWMLVARAPRLELPKRDTSGIPHVLVGVVERGRDACSSFRIGYAAEGGDRGSAD